LNNGKRSFEENANMAFTGQYFFSEIMQKLLDGLYKLYPSENLIYTGGCALNSSFNGEIVKRTRFKKIYIPSAPSDDGNAVGAALLSFYKDNPLSDSIHRSYSPYLGSCISGEVINKFFKFSGMRKTQHCADHLAERTSTLLAEGKIVGWIQGRAEFGPRALGNRSILADPRSPSMKNKINSTIKFREEFRPFAPSILHEYGNEYFEDYDYSPFMEKTFYYRKEVINKIPAVVHVDNTGRLQSVKKEMNEKFYSLIKSFNDKTGVPLLLNTSFNIMGKPIIHTMEDAIGVFFTSGLDVLVAGDYVIEK
jgi:carbamoyltransferase